MKEKSIDKTKRSSSSEYGGIHIELKEQIAPSHIRNKVAIMLRPFFQYLVILAALFGAIFSFTEMMKLPINSFAVIISGAVLSVAFMLLFKFIKRFYIVLLSAFGVLGIVYLICRDYVNYGVSIIYDNSMAQICKSMRWTAPERLIEKPDGNLAVIYTTLAICMVVFLLSMLITMFVYKFISFIGVFASTFPLFEIGAAFGCTTNHIAFALMLSSWASVLVLYFSGRQKFKIKQIIGKKKSAKKVKGTQNSGKFAFSAVCVAVATFILFTVSQSVLISMNYDRTDNMNSLRSSIKNAWSDFYDYVTGVDRDGSLKEGRLYEMGDLKYKNRHYITVQMPSVAENVYLKGYIGSKYTGNSFEDVDLSEYQSIFDAMDKLYATIPTALGAVLDSSEKNYLYPSGDVKLYDFRRKKDYSYLTYGAYPIGEFTTVTDKTVSSNNKDEYKYLSYFDTSIMYDLSGTELYNNATYQKLFSQYQSIVEKEYVLKEQDVSDTVKKVLDNFTKKSKYARVDEIRAYLAENIEFSYQSRKLPEGKDFVDYVLNEQKSGYTAHFASVATVLLQASNIPARYVEGYYLPETYINESENVVSDNIKKVNVTDLNAHAWVEIFIDDYGWVPVDVTPGFYSDSFEEMMGQQNENNEPEEEEPEEEQIEDFYESDFKDLEQIGMDEEKSNATEETILNEAEMVVRYIIIAVIVLVALLLISILAIVLQRFIRVSRLKNSLTHGKVNDRMTHLNNYFMKLVKLDNIKYSGVLSYAELYNNCKQSNYISCEEIDTLYKLFTHFAFSGENLSESDYSTAKEIVLKYADKLYVNNNQPKRFKRFIGKLKFKYIYAMR